MPINLHEGRGSRRKATSTLFFCQPDSTKKRIPRKNAGKVFLRLIFAVSLKKDLDCSKRVVFPTIEKRWDEAYGRELWPGK